MTKNNNNHLVNFKKYKDRDLYRGTRKKKDFNNKIWIKTCLFKKTLI